MNFSELHLLHFYISLEARDTWQGCTKPKRFLNIRKSLFKRLWFLATTASKDVQFLNSTANLLNHEHLRKPTKVLKITAGCCVMSFEQECINFIPYLALRQAVAFFILKQIPIIIPARGVMMGLWSIIPPAPNHYWGAELLREAPKSPNDVTSNFFKTVNLLPKEVKLNHGGATLASFPGCNLALLRPWCPI